MGTLQLFRSPYITSNKETAPRLGSLLHMYRASVGETAKTVSRRSVLGPVEIAQLELGRADLDADQLADAVAAYRVSRRVFPEGRCSLTVDLTSGLVEVHVGDTEVEETRADTIVLTYLELIFASNDLAPATPMPFTALDLDVLRVILSSRRGAVTQHLRRIVGPMDEPVDVERAGPTRRTARNAVLLLAAAATTFAAVVGARDSATSRKPAVVPIEVQIIDALVVTREIQN